MRYRIQRSVYPVCLFCLATCGYVFVISTEQQSPLATSIARLLLPASRPLVVEPAAEDRLARAHCHDRAGVLSLEASGVAVLIAVLSPYFPVNSAGRMSHIVLRCLGSGSLLASLSRPGPSRPIRRQNYHPPHPSNSPIRAVVAPAARYG